MLAVQFLISRRRALANYARASALSYPLRIRNPCTLLDTICCVVSCAYHTLDVAFLWCPVSKRLLQTNNEPVQAEMRQAAATERDNHAGGASILTVSHGPASPFRGGVQAIVCASTSGKHARHIWSAVAQSDSQAPASHRQECRGPSAERHRWLGTVIHSDVPQCHSAQRPLHMREPLGAHTPVSQQCSLDACHSHTQ